MASNKKQIRDLQLRLVTLERIVGSPEHHVSRTKALTPTMPSIEEVIETLDKRQIKIDKAADKKAKKEERKQQKKHEKKLRKLQAKTKNKNKAPDLHGHPKHEKPEAETGSED
jgi:hypothetical protein